MSAPMGLDRSRLGWWMVGIALSTVILFVFHAFIGTFVFGLFIYYATRPVYRRVRQRVYPPSIAAATAIFLLALPALIIVFYTIAIGIQELGRLTQVAEVGQLGAIVEQYGPLTEIAQHPEELLTNGGLEGFQRVFESMMASLGAIAIGLLHLFIMIAIAFYLLRDGHRLSRWFRQVFGDDGGVLDEYLDQVDRDLNAIFFGNILNAIITGTIGAITYTLLNLLTPPGLRVPYPVLLGLLTGVASLIPIVGMKLVYVPSALYLVFRAVLEDPAELLWFAMVFLGISFVVVDTIPDLVLRPYVSGRSLHVGTVMLAYIFGPLLFGWYGLFLGPVLLVLVVHFYRIVLPELLGGDRIRPYAVDPAYSGTPAETHERIGPAGAPAGVRDRRPPGAADGRNRPAAHDVDEGDETPEDGGAEPSEERADTGVAQGRDAGESSAESTDAGVEKGRDEGDPSNAG